jgi:hypothetical protein
MIYKNKEGSIVTFKYNKTKNFIAILISVVVLFFAITSVNPIKYLFLIIISIYFLKVLLVSIYISIIKFDFSKEEITLINNRKKEVAIFSFDNIDIIIKGYRNSEDVDLNISIIIVNNIDNNKYQLYTHESYKDTMRELLEYLGKLHDEKHIKIIEGYNFTKDSLKKLYKNHK